MILVFSCDLNQKNNHSSTSAIKCAISSFLYLYILYPFLPSCLFRSKSSIFLTPLSSYTPYSPLLILYVHFSYILPFFHFFHRIEDLKTVSTMHCNVTIKPAFRISFYCILLSDPIILLHYVFFSVFSLSGSYSSFISKLTHRISGSILLSTFKISKKYAENRSLSV